MPYISPSTLYQDNSESFKEYWKDSESLYHNCYYLLSEAVLLPEHSVQMPIVVGYSLLNQKWAKSMPILFLHGLSGSAKSQIITFNKALHDVKQIQGAECTFVSLRNEIQRQYWIDEESGFIRDGAMLLFDNAWERTFLNDDKLLAMLLRSYEVGNAVITTSSSTSFGDNKSYCVFSSKIISSVSMFQSPRLSEIQRRILIVRCKRLKDFTPEELEDADNFDPLDLDSLDWGGIYSEYFNFWNQEDTCIAYTKHRQYLSDRRHKVRQRTVKAYQWFTEERYKVSIDLICTLMVSGGASTYEEAIGMLAAFYELTDTNLGRLKGSSEEIVKDYIALHLQTVELTGDSENINPKLLKQHIVKHVELGLMPEEMKRDKAIGELMVSLGWSLSKEGWVRA